MRTLRIAIPALVALVAASAGAQNLFTNPDLDENDDGWILVCGTSPTWQTDDEAGCPGSGSEHVTGGPCLGILGASVGQCLPVGTMTVIEASGRVRAPSGFVGIAMEFYDGADCSGNVLAQTNTGPLPATGDWQTVTDSQPVPGGSVSVGVGLGSADFAPVEADVDSGYAGADPLVFRDGFEGDTQGDTVPCRWSSVVP